MDALDAARTAVRNGAKQVHVLTSGKLSSRSNLAEQIAMAKEEGVEFIENADLLEVVSNGADITVSGVKAQFPCDLVIASGSPQISANMLGSIKTEKGHIKVSAKTGETDAAGVFAGGDAVRPMNMINAIASAKQVAASMDRFIQGEKATLNGIMPVETVDREIVLRRHGYIKKDKNYMNLTIQKPAERIQDFEFDTRVMTEEEARREASRCLNCGCGEGCQICKTICTDFAPYISGADTLQIDRDKCVACGMCALRCPIGNIEMVNLGTTV
jgi:NADPH-dependent glutamate synthase beta subunit-like oxidoreductase